MKTKDESTNHQPARDIDLSLIDPSPFQRREHFDEDEMSSLASSIQKFGQLDDAIVRPMATGRFELIAGARRKRASERIGRPVLTCKVREMSDDDARETVIVQQLQHAAWAITEEAKGYADLLAIRDDGQPRFTYESLAARIDRKEGHIRELVALLDAPQEMREAVDAKTVSKRAAAAVASVWDPDQRELAAKMVLHPTGKTTPLTAVETIALLQREFQRSLQGAPFSTKDATLLPEAGSCEDCRFRTGKMEALATLLQDPRGGGRGLSAGIAPNLCTRPSCYLEKSELVAGQVMEAARRRGCELMPDDEAAGLFDAFGDLRDNVDYVDLDAKPDPTLCHHYNEEKLTTWRKLLKAQGAHKVKAWLAKNPATNEFVELVKWADAVKSVNDGCRELGGEPFFKGQEQGAGGKGQGAGAGETILPGQNIMVPEKPKEMWDEDTARQAKHEARVKQAGDAERLHRLLVDLHTKLPDALLNPELWKPATRLFADNMLHLVGGEEVVVEMCDYYQLPRDHGELLEKFADIPAHGKTAFLMMIMVRRVALRFGVDSSTLSEWCELLGVEGQGTEAERHQGTEPEPEPEVAASEGSEVKSPAPDETSDGPPCSFMCDGVECLSRIDVPRHLVAQVEAMQDGEFLCTNCGGPWVPRPAEPEPVKKPKKAKGRKGTKPAVRKAPSKPAEKPLPKKAKSLRRSNAQKASVKAQGKK